MRNSPSPETNREIFEYEAFPPHDPPLIRRQTCAYLRVMRHPKGKLQQKQKVVNKK